MAPRKEHAVTTVYSTQVRSHDERSIVVESGAFTPARWFLEHGSRPEKGDVEPPRKRRKTAPTDDDDGRDTTCTIEDSEEVPAEAIPLFRACIDFHFPDSVQSKSPSADALANDVDFEGMPSLPVVPYGVESHDAGSRLRLGLPRGKGPVLVIECGEVPNHLLEMIRSIALHGQLKFATSNSRRKTHPASLLSCTLTRSGGPTYTVIRLQASLKWRSGVSAFPAGAPVGAAKVYPDYDILLRSFPDDEREAYDHTRAFNPQEFYESVHATSNDADTEGLYEDVLESQLYPFQKRAVTWMLKRESVGPSRHVSPLTDAGAARSPSEDELLRESGDSTQLAHPSETNQPDLRFCRPVLDIDGHECWVNHFQGIISREPPPDGTAGLSGGLLAEEMGLGKTVELMALASLNKRPRLSPGKILDRVSATTVFPSRATLIVTPNSLTQQWKSEFTRHAPGLTVFYYEGIPTGNRKGDSEEDVISKLCQVYDVVITTYHILAREVHFAEDPPDRSMRHARKFDRKRSPLVQIQWWRVCLDEAQMVESGVTAAARVACRLPSVHRWAVSGTPLRKDVQDLQGLLIFLRYKPFSDDNKLWSHLITNHRHHFRKIFSQIALRHTKAKLRDELTLPPQKRVVVTVPFSVVEQQNYTTLFNHMCEEIGVNFDGSPKLEDWNPEDPGTIEAMRSWLVRLRQTCLHPQVGGKNRRALGRGNSPLRTVAEVLEVMIEQNETNLRVEERALAAASLLRAHILGNNGEDDHRAQKAVEIYESTMATSEQMVVDARGKLAAAKVANPDANHSTDTDEEDSSTESTPLMGRLKNHLRTALELQHQCTFFAATSYFQIKMNESLTVPDSEQFKQLESKEISLYDRAKLARKELMRDTFRKAERLMGKIKDLGEGDKYTQLPKIKDLQSLGGIESRRIVEKSDELFDVIREQVEVIKDWRMKMAGFLLKQLVDEDEGMETTGDEYEDSTKQQDELYAYFDAFKAIHADLNSFITGEGTPLTDHEVKFAVQNAKWVLDPDTEEGQKPTGVHAPQLTLELYGIRNKFRNRRNQIGSVRALIVEARALEGSMQFSSAGSRAALESSLVQKHITSLQNVFSAYSKALNGLEKEVDLFRSTQNQRVEFYRQLQELSDSVSPYREELDEQLDQHALGVAIQKEEQASKSSAQLKTKQRFLVHLREDEQGSGPKICIICTSTFERGVLTVCGHQFCKDCLTHWFAQSKSCPMCKRQLRSHDIHDITFKPQEIRAQEETHDGEASSSQSKNVDSASTHASIYTDVDSKLMDEIKSIDLPASYGSKIDTLGRHLHWIRENDPGAKSIVFSQYREFLDVLGSALKEFKIGYARLGRSGAVEKFRNDASVDCLLLDAKTDSSGLTLVNATHVFICEPLIQTAVELQAIARVHRIGQTRSTTVWMYLINDTVEEAIYEVSVARRLAHVQSRQRSRREGKSRSATPAPLQENAIDAANSEELQSAPLTKLLVAGKGGGEVVGKEDLWNCLFGKAQKMQTSAAADREVGRHLRAEAAEARVGSRA